MQMFNSLFYKDNKELNKMFGKWTLPAEAAH